MKKNDSSILELISITKTFNSTIVLDNVNASFQKGKVTSIYGSNGAGKSTLIKIICGEEKQDGGSVFFKGNKIAFKKYKDALENGISYIPQDLGLLNNLTAIENIAIAQNQISKKYVYFESKIDKFIKKTKKSDLPFPYPNSLVEDLSAYDKQLLAIHKVLLFNAEIIIFDESTTNINKNDFKKFKRLIEGLKNEGKTIIFISHKLDEVFEISDSLIILRNGKVIKQIGIDEASKDEVIDLFITNKKNKNIQAENNKDNLCKILIEYDKINNLNTSIDKGEIAVLR